MNGLILLLLAAAAGGCGYAMEPQRLPENAASLGIGTIRNLTYTGELDLRLQSELRRRLLGNPAFVLTTPERSELILDVELSRADLSRSIDVSNTNISSLSMNLVGSASLRRGRGEDTIVIRSSISVTAALNFDRAIIETPAVRDEIANDSIIAFAKKVEAMLYQHF